MRDLELLALTPSKTGLLRFGTHFSNISPNKEKAYKEAAKIGGKKGKVVSIPCIIFETDNKKQLEALINTLIDTMEN